MHHSVNLPSLLISVCSNTDNLYLWLHSLSVRMTYSSKTTLSSSASTQRYRPVFTESSVVNLRVPSLVSKPLMSMSGPMLFPFTRAAFHRWRFPPADKQGRLLVAPLRTMKEYSSAVSAVRRRAYVLSTVYARHHQCQAKDFTQSMRARGRQHRAPFSLMTLTLDRVEQ